MNKPKKVIDVSNERENFMKYLLKVCDTNQTNNLLPESMTKEFLGVFGGLGALQKQKTFQFKKQETKNLGSPGLGSLQRKDSGRLQNLQKALLSHNKNVEVEKIAWDVKTWMPKFANSIGTSLLLKRQNTLARQKESVELLNKIAAICSKNNTHHEDDEFIKEAQSIIGFGESHLLDKRFVERIKWVRPGNFFKDKYYIYEKIAPNDICQGLLGDCYFLSALASIAENPKRIKKIFISKQTNEIGAYCVQFYINGMVEHIIVDDHFPVWKENDKIQFNRSEENEQWVMILEKAWAKIYGGYANIEEGFTSEALSDLTGAPTTVYTTDDEDLTPDERFGILWHADNKNYIMCAGTKNLCEGYELEDPRRNDLEHKETGLIGAHAYALISAYILIWKGSEWVLLNWGEQYDTDSKIEKLLTLRNPWGQVEWKNAWSDEDKEWGKVCSETKKKIMFDNRNDGIFYMRYEDFEKYFSHFELCYYHDNYKKSSYKMETGVFQNKSLQFEVSKNGLHYFSLHQINERFWSYNKGYSYSNCSLIIIREISDENSENQTGVNYELIGNICDKRADGYFEFECVPGTYYANIFTPWESHSNTITFSIYGPNKTEIFEKEDSFIENEWIEKAMAYNQIQYNLFDPFHENDIFFKFVKSNAIGYIVFKNVSDSIVLDLKADFGDSMIIMQGKNEGKTIATIESKPGDISVIWWRQSDEEFKLSFGFDVELKSTSDLAIGEEINKAENTKRSTCPLFCS